MSLGEIPETVEHRRHSHRDGGLARSRAAREAHVQVRTFRLEPETAARHVDDEQRRDLADPGLHWVEPDQLTIEVLDHVEDPGGSGICLDIDADRQRCRLLLRAQSLDAV